MLQQYKTILTTKTQLNRNVYLFRFALSAQQQLDFKAGQYMILVLPDGKQRLYSICSADREKQYFDLVVELIEGGAGSTYLQSLQIAAEVNFKGPAGIFIKREENSRRDIVFLVTGTGIAPARSIILSNLNPKSQILNPKKIYLFWGLKKREDVYFLEEFQKLAQENNNFKFKICLSREDDQSKITDCFVKGRIDVGLNNMFEQEKMIHDPRSMIHEFVNKFDYYLCGSKIVVESLLKFLQEKGVPQEQIVVERFG